MSQASFPSQRAASLLSSALLISVDHSLETHVPAPDTCSSPSPVAKAWAVLGVRCFWCHPQTLIPLWGSFGPGFRHFQHRGGEGSVSGEDAAQAAP